MTFRAPIDRLLNALVPCDIARLYAVPASRLREPQRSHGDCEFRLLTASDIDVLSQIEDSELGLDMKTVLDKGEADCLAAFVEGELAGYSWFGQGNLAPRHNRAGSRFAGVGLAMQQDVRFLFKAYVRPHYRGASLWHWLFYKGAMEVFAASHLILTTGWTNTAVHISADRAGFDLIGNTLEAVVGSRHYYRLPDTQGQPFELYRGTPGSAGDAA